MPGVVGEIPPGPPPPLRQEPPLEGLDSLRRVGFPEVAPVAPAPKREVEGLARPPEGTLRGILPGTPGVPPRYGSVLQAPRPPHAEAGEPLAPRATGPRRLRHPEAEVGPEVAETWPVGPEEPVRRPETASVPTEKGLKERQPERAKGGVVEGRAVGEVL